MIDRRALVIGAGALLGLARHSALAESLLESAAVPLEPDTATPTARMPVSDDDIRLAFARPWKYAGTLLEFAGKVIDMRVAPPGQGYPVGRAGSQRPYRTRLVLDVTFDDGGRERILVAIDTDPPGIRQDQRVVVVGEYRGEHIEAMATGGTWRWPYFVAESIDLVSGAL